MLVSGQPQRPWGRNPEPELRGLRSSGPAVAQTLGPQQHLVEGWVSRRRLHLVTGHKNLQILVKS